MLDATEVVERDRTSWSGIGAPSMKIVLVAGAAPCESLDASLSNLSSAKSLGAAHAQRILVSNSIRNANATGGACLRTVFCRTCDTPQCL